jgi:hypothetical protein
MEKNYRNKKIMSDVQFLSLKGLTEGITKVINKLDYNEEWILESKWKFIGII